MFTTKQAQLLLQLPKKVEQNGQMVDNLTFTQPFPFTLKYTLISPDDADYVFLNDITQSTKNHFKLTLYLMEDESKIGLLRVDFNGQHKNPETLSENVPEIFHPFVGKFFDYHEHYIHYYVEGYKTTLDWAVPLVYDSFPVKSIVKTDDIKEAFLQFNTIINLQTSFTINPILL
jgi:hypothetical protein